MAGETFWARTDMHFRWCMSWVESMCEESRAVRAGPEKRRHPWKRFERRARIKHGVALIRKCFRLGNVHGRTCM
jgi:hypothetical protein